MKKASQKKEEATAGALVAPIAQPILEAGEVLIRHRRINDKHPRGVQLEKALRAAPGPMKLTDIGLVMFPGAANGAAMVSTYMTPLIKAGRVRRVGWGLYEAVREQAEPMSANRN